MAEQHHTASTTAQEHCNPGEGGKKIPREEKSEQRRGNSDSEYGRQMKLSVNWTVESSCRFGQLKEIRIGAKSGADFGGQEFLKG